MGPRIGLSGLLGAALALTSACSHASLPGAAARLPLGASALAASDYYGKLNARQTGRALLTSLHNLITKHTDLGYTPARDFMFGTLDDVTNIDEIVDVYSGRQFRGVTNAKSAFERGANAEHAWCQSMGAAGVAKDDLHILFPVDAGANSIRNNHPYGEVTKVDQELPDFYGDGQHSLLGTGSAGSTTVFEPRASQRGDMARAVFYFYTCYGHFDGKPDTIDLTNFKLEEATLLKWHQQDPPSSWEIKRNEAIFKKQGNRNPYVDHPEWVGQVGKFLSAK